MTEIVAGGAVSASTADLLIVPVFADLTWGPRRRAGRRRVGALAERLSGVP